MILDMTNGRQILRPLALVTALPLLVISALVAWRSVVRLYTAYQFNHGQIFSDDLTVGHVSVRFEIEVGCLVLGLAVAAFLLLRFWQDSNVDQ